MKPRYQTVTVHGDLVPKTTQTPRPQGCAYVYDRLCDRIVASFPTEGERASKPWRFLVDCEKDARERCAELNARPA